MNITSELFICNMHVGSQRNDFCVNRMRYRTMYLENLTDKNEFAMDPHAVQYYVAGKRAARHKLSHVTVIKCRSYVCLK